MPSDELYRRLDTPPLTKRRYAKAGFTLADVRRLAKELKVYSFYRNPHDLAALAPFASLLKEKNDG